MDKSINPHDLPDIDAVFPQRRTAQARCDEAVVEASAKRESAERKLPSLEQSIEVARARLARLSARLATEKHALIDVEHRSTGLGRDAAAAAEAIAMAVADGDAAAAADHESIGSALRSESDGLSNVAAGLRTLIATLGQQSQHEQAELDRLSTQREHLQREVTEAIIRQAQASWDRAANDLVAHAHQLAILCVRLNDRNAVANRFATGMSLPVFDQGRCLIGRCHSGPGGLELHFDPGHPALKAARG